jgi:hypothetical protein
LIGVALAINITANLAQRRIVRKAARQTKGSEGTSSLPLFVSFVNFCSKSAAATADLVVLS